MKAKRASIIAEAAVTFGGRGIRMTVDLADMPMQDRRDLFSTLLRDPEVVTAAPGSPEHEAFVAACQAACKWSA